MLYNILVINMEAYRSGHNGTDSKSVVPNGTVGSNPTASANKKAFCTLFCVKGSFLFPFQVKRIKDSRVNGCPFSYFNSYSCPLIEIALTFDKSIAIQLSKRVSFFKCVSKSPVIYANLYSL